MKIDRDLGIAPYLLAAVAFLAAIGLAIYLSHRLARYELERQADQLASAVLAQSHSISDQIGVAFKVLRASGSVNSPCSPGSIALMARLALGASYLQDVGYVRDDRLLCTSRGHLGAGIPLGPADYVSGLGNAVRTAVRLPFAGDELFVVSTNVSSGYSAIALPNLALDLMKDDAELALGLFGVQSRKLILHRGVTQPEWLAPPFDRAGLARREDAGLVIAFRRSPRYDFAAYAALPLTRMWPEWRRYGQILVPLAAISGAVLAGFILLLAKRQKSLLNQLRRAVRGHELFLVYQPIVDLQSGAWMGAEALVRWRRPDGRLIGPDVFIPLAEQSDLICEVTAKVLEMAARDAVAIFRVCPQFHLSVNLSSRDLSDPGVIHNLTRALGKEGIRYENMVIEVTERVLVQMEDVSRNVRALRKLGMKVAIDDFGTGYSGLSYLTALELDYLKIDKLFVDTIGTDAATNHVVAHIIEIAKSLSLKMIAEGVETAAQADYLKARGVQYAQGWLYSKAVGVEVLTTRLAT